MLTPLADVLLAVLRSEMLLRRVLRSNVLFRDFRGDMLLGNGLRGNVLMGDVLRGNMLCRVMMMMDRLRLGCARHASTEHHCNSGQSRGESRLHVIGLRKVYNAC